MELESCRPPDPTLLPRVLEKGNAFEPPPAAESPANLRAGSVVIVVTGAALVARLLLSPVLQDDAAFLPFIFAVMVSSWYGGFRAGLLATLLSSAGAWFFLLRPYYVTPAQMPAYAVQLGLFIGIGLLVSVINEGWHRARKRLTIHEEFLSTILESTPTGVLVLDAEGYVTFVNSAAAALFGLGSGLLVGRPYEEIGLVAKGPAPSLNELLTGERPAGSFRLIVQDAAAASIEVEVRVTRVRMANQQPSGAVLSLLPLEMKEEADV